MKRREFIIGAGTAAAALAIASRAAYAVPGQIDWYTSSDQNILDFWTNVVKPKFEAANPGTTINLVDGGDSAGLQAIADRAIAALGTNADPQADFFEGFDARLPVGALDKGLWVDFSKENLSNYSKINPLAFKIDDQRGRVDFVDRGANAGGRRCHRVLPIGRRLDIMKALTSSSRRSHPRKGRRGDQGKGARGWTRYPRYVWSTCARASARWKCCAESRSTCIAAMSSA